MQRKLVIFALTTVAVAQQSEAPIKVTTRLIETNVIVRDHHGPVGDLTEKDFKLFDSGKEQKIAVFRVSKVDTTVSTTPTPPLPLVFSRIATRKFPRARSVTSCCFSIRSIPIRPIRLSCKSKCY
jgi:hypothetical protein